MKSLLHQMGCKNNTKQVYLTDHHSKMYLMECTQMFDDTKKNEVKSTKKN